MITKQICVSVIFICALLLAAPPTPAQTSPFVNVDDACDNGPAGLITGDLVLFNGLVYCVLVGTESAETLFGIDDKTNCDERDIIWGLGGGDVIYGGDGDDILCGGDGADTLNGERGDDTLWGGPDGDLLNGDSGSDSLYGRGGDDVMHGGDGKDHDSIDVPSGEEAGLWGGDGNDQMYGGPGADWLAGQNGDDFLFGGDGNDEMGGGPDYDTVDGGANNDKCMGEVQINCEGPLFPPP